MPRATWFCIDIECSGPIPNLYDMISLGAVPVHQTPKGAVVSDAKLYVEIRPTGPRVDPGAMAVNGLDIDDLKAFGLTEDVALDRLDAFVAEHTEAGSKPVFVGHNAPFDWMFVNYAYVSRDRKNPFGYKALDTKALASGILGLHWFDSNKEKLAEILNLPAVVEEKVHRADYDAWYQAHVLARLLDAQHDGLS